MACFHQGSDHDCDVCFVAVVWSDCPGRAGAVAKSTIVRMKLRRNAGLFKASWLNISFMVANADRNRCILLAQRCQRKLFLTFERLAPAPRSPRPLSNRGLNQWSGFRT